MIGEGMAAKRTTAGRNVKAEKSKADKAAKEKEGVVQAAETALETEPMGKEQEQRFDVEFYRDWCKGCGICAAFCPAAALSLNDRGEPEITKPELCTGCKWCEIRCPDFAIRVKEKKKEVCEA